MAQTYLYKVRDRGGKLVEGSLDGDSQALVVTKLKQMGYVPISVDQKSSSSMKKDLKIPGFGGKGRAVACEVLVATSAVRNLIREDKTHQIYSAMQSGGRYGMVTMDQSLAALVKSNQIPMDAAIERCANESDLRRLISGQ